MFQPQNVSKISLNEIEKIEEVDKLSAKQLKIILLSNFVDYRGCKERHELITKVKMLWESHQANKKFYEKLVSQTGQYVWEEFNKPILVVRKYGKLSVYDISVYYHTTYS